MVDNCLRLVERPKINFKEGEANYSDPAHDDAMEIFVRMVNAQVKQVMIDIGSFTDVLYLDAFQKIGSMTGDLLLMTLSLIGYTGDSISLLGIVNLHVTFREEPHFKTLTTRFMMVDVPSAYNAIIGRPTLNCLKAMVSI